MTLIEGPEGFLLKFEFCFVFGKIISDFTDIINKNFQMHFINAKYLKVTFMVSCLIFYKVPWISKSGPLLGPHQCIYDLMMIVYLLNLFCRERKNQTGVRRTIPECSGQESERNGRNEENLWRTIERTRRGKCQGFYYIHNHHLV